MLRISNLTGFNTLLPTGGACLPYQIETFPVLDYFPIDSDFVSWDRYFYDNPSLDGVSLNLNLGGWAASWENDGSEPPYQGVYTYLPTNRVDGGVIFNYIGDDPFIRNDYTRSFNIFDNSAAYNIVGGSYDGTYNPAPGHHVYPIVASFNSEQSFVQPKNYGEPIIFELWYSLNNDRINRTKGYSNYTFYGPGYYCLPWVWLGYYSDPYGTTRKVKKYQGGILKADADMYNLQESDFIAGVSYVDSGTGATAKLIRNGSVIQSSAPGSNNRVSGNVNCSFIDYVSLFGNCKSWVGDLEISYTNNLSSDYLYSSGYDESWNYDPAAFIDTYHTKWAWIVDCETSGNPYDDAIFCDNGTISMFTLPNFDLPCDPGITLPSYIPPIPLTP